MQLVAITTIEPLDGGEAFFALRVHAGTHTFEVPIDGQQRQIFMLNNQASQMPPQAPPPPQIPQAPPYHEDDEYLQYQRNLTETENSVYNEEYDEDGDLIEPPMIVPAMGVGNHQYYDDDEVDSI